MVTDLLAFPGERDGEDRRRRPWHWPGVSRSGLNRPQLSGGDRGDKEAGGQESRSQEEYLKELRGKELKNLQETHDVKGYTKEDLNEMQKRLEELKEYRENAEDLGRSAAQS